MTLRAIESKIKHFRPGSEAILTPERLLSYIDDVEKRIYNDIILKHEIGPSVPVPILHDGERGYNEELMLPDEYTDIYVYYACSKIDLIRNEIDRYANSSALYNAAIEEYARYINRHYLPKQMNKIHIGGI